jgi:cell division protein FtsZ
VNITTGEDIGIFEVQEAMNLLYQMTDPEEANIIFGHVIKPGMTDVVQVTVLATGFPEEPLSKEAAVQMKPQPEPHPLDITRARMDAATPRTPTPETASLGEPRARTPTPRTAPLARRP